ncbi:hypothetical protein [Desulfonatronum sp. SC1]|uniref:hypothetical protein n=1 Tax=Desulfonatronum sp. SC1 TaxID=2109626 RepID=UPI000D309839|nr:hypothetical protein [Desulfonatronum sp. SC1]PTN37170.1 hypothetical protein C6366_07205 [Desulfonatronum sp. SC1]
MQEIRLKRMNHPDLVFNGDLVASVDDQRMTASIHTRLQLSLYKTAVGRFILALALHHFPSSEPKTFHGALAFDSFATIRDFLASEDGRALSDTAGQLLERTGHAPRSAMRAPTRMHQRSGHV